MTTPPDIQISAGPWELTPWYARWFAFKTPYRRWVVITANRQVNGFWLYINRKDP